MFKAIQKMKFHLRTGFGDSDTTYQCEDDSHPYQGYCQGNGAAPSLWLLISAFIILYMKSAGHTMKLLSALTQEVLSYTTLMFVDDGDFPTIAHSSEEPITSVITRHQETVNCWSAGLRVTGGALKPEKCFWYPIEWKWTKGIAHCVIPNKHTPDILVTSPDGMTMPITRLKYLDSREIMGVIQAPSGDMEGQISKLEKIIGKWLPFLTNGYLHRRLVWRGFWGKLWPSLRYPLPAMTLTKIQSKELMMPLLKVLIPKLGVTTALPLAYRYSSVKYLGLGIPSLHLEQTIEKLTYYMMHFNASTLTGKHMRHSAEQLQLELGIGTFFIHASFREYGKYTTSCWMKSLWQEVSRLPIKITHTRPPDDTITA